MVKTRTYYSCHICGKEFENDYGAALNHEKIPVDFSNIYQGIVAKDAVWTRLFIHDPNKINKEHHTIYVQFSIDNKTFEELKFNYLWIDFPIPSVYADRFPKEETLTSGKKLWEKVKFEYNKKSSDPEIKKLIESLKNLELRSLSDFK